MDIKKWLSEFNNAWSNHDIDRVLSLFTDNVEYWETPHYRVASKQELENEWQAVKSQQNINLHTEVYVSTPDNKHTVIWQLSYERDGELRQSGGTYLISLDDQGKCHFFHYVSAAKA